MLVDLRAGYNDGAFDDKRALSMSAWASTLPPEILAESLGVNTSDISDGIAANTFTFLPLGPVPDISLDDSEHHRSAAGAGRQADSPLPGVGIHTPGEPLFLTFTFP